jgi:hypothetical protein
MFKNRCAGPWISRVSATRSNILVPHLCVNRSIAFGAGVRRTLGQLFEFCAGDYLLLGYRFELRIDSACALFPSNLVQLRSSVNAFVSPGL